MEIFQAIANHAATGSSNPAIIDDDGMILWSELEQTVNRLALGLVHSGMRRGKGVGILVGRSRHQALSVLATIRGGGMAIPLPSCVGHEGLARILLETRPSILIYDRSMEKLVAALRNLYEFRAVVSVNEAGPGELSWESLAQTDITGARFPVLSEDVKVLTQYGFDEAGNVISGDASLRNLWFAVKTAARGLKLKDRSRCLSLFSSGLNSYESILRAIKTGGVAVFCRSLQPEDVCVRIEDSMVDCLIAPPAYYQLLCSFEAEAGNAPQMPECLEARGHVSVGLRHLVRKTFGREMLSTWGAVNTFGPVIGSIPTGFGAPPSPLQAYPGVMDRIVSPDGNEILGSEVGEMELSGEGISCKNDPLGNIGAIPWLKTGIIACRFESGEIWLLGDKYDVILRDGKRVYPQIVSHAIELIPGVLEARTLLVPQGIGNFALVAAVIMMPGESLDFSGMRKILSDKMSFEELPDDLLVLGNFPRLADGGVDGKRLRALAEKQLFR